MSDRDSDAMKFVSALAHELGAGAVRLPSLPDVVMKIRKLLEQETCDFDRVAEVVSTDPVLVSKLLIFANSAAYNASGDRVKSLDVAISRLGFELVRNTAISIAVKQLFLGRQHKAIANQVRDLWARSMQFSSLAHAIAEKSRGVNQETAFLCGLMHDVGKLYILSKSKDFPAFLGDPLSLQLILDEWHRKVGKSILEAWQFPAEVCDSIDPAECLDDLTHHAPVMADVMLVAEHILSNAQGGGLDFAEIPSCVRLEIDEDKASGILIAYKGKLQSVQQALAKAA